ncbi:MAG: TetR/AcrR family transcriptional regulator [Bacteroidota bacterium]
MSDRKKEIVEAASSLIRKHGYTAVSMRTLAKEVGIKAASLYNHISSKQEILEEIVLGIAQRFTDGMAAAQRANDDPIEQIKQIIALHIELTLQSTTDMEVMQNNWMYLEGQSMIDYKKSRNAYEQDLRQIIKAGIAKGSIRDMNPELLIYSLLSPLRYLYIWFPRQEGMDAERLKGDLVSVLLEGIKD